jgi:hypothetical protein
MASRRPAADLANWRSPTDLWLDHARVAQDDLEWMAGARYLVLWNVEVPDGFLARLENLRGLSVRGGSAEDLAVVEGCEALLCLDVDQVRGLHDLSHVVALRASSSCSSTACPAYGRCQTWTRWRRCTASSSAR